MGCGKSPTERKRKEKSMIRILTFLILTFILTSAQAYACSCTEDSFTDEASHSNIAKAALIVEGSLHSISLPSGDEVLSIAEINIDKILKGKFEKERIGVYVDTSTSCGTPPEQLNMQKLFVLYPYEEQKVIADICSGYISTTHRVMLQIGEYAPPEKDE